MNKARADEIVRSTFYRHISYLSETIYKNRDNSALGFEVGRIIGIMQKDLENELKKEVNDNEQSI